MEIGSTHRHHDFILKPDGSQNRESPENCGKDEFREGSGLLPGDVAHRIFGPDSEGVEGLEDKRSEIAKVQRDLISAAGFFTASRLSALPFSNFKFLISNFQKLMGSAWWHDEEDLVLLDARKPNFKKTDFGVLPIDLFLADLSPEMRQRFLNTDH